MDQSETCRFCRFWYPTSKVKQQVSSAEERKIAARGQCRRYAPQPSALTTAWMVTKSEEWCGEFRPTGG